MKKALLKVAVMLLCLAGVTPAMAQFNLKKQKGILKKQLLIVRVILTQEI